MIYKNFKEGRTPDVWICETCSTKAEEFEIQINAERYYNLSSRRRRKALELEADEHIKTCH